jgi:hypothetical protein
MINQVDLLFFKAICVEAALIVFGGEQASTLNFEKID